jgi:DNA-binding NtrC family response regulator
LYERNYILIIDDESDQVKLFSEILENSGYKTIGFDNSLMAKDYVYYHHSEILLVLIDLRMPLITGFQIIKVISELDKDIEIIVLSASEIDVNQLEEIKNYTYLKKPVSMQRLVETVNKLNSTNKNTESLLRIK